MDKNVFIEKTNKLKPWISLQDVAKHCGFSYETVRKYILDQYRANYNPVAAQKIYDSCVVLFNKKKAEMSTVNA